MKIGILADIHECVIHLRSALQAFRENGVDQVVVLGDIFETGKYIDETVQLLRDVNAFGVWGNHDVGLSHEPDPRITSRYGTAVVEFFSSLSAHFELGDVLLCHGLPTWDATDPSIYYLGDSPWKAGSLSPVFTSFPHRIFLTGHYHRWHLATADQSTEWDGLHPIVFEPTNRYFVVVNAVLYGWCAILDTETGEFKPCILS